MVVEMQMGELVVAVLQIERDFALGRAGGAAHFGDRVFESIRKFDAGTQFFAGALVADRLAAGIDQAIDKKLACSRCDIDFEVDRLKQGGG